MSHVVDSTTSGCYTDEGTGELVPSVFVLHSDAARDFELGRFVVSAIADLGLSVYHLALESFVTKREALETALEQAQYYVVIFSEKFKKDAKSAKHLNILFEKFVSRRQKTVLPVHFDVSEQKMRNMFPVFNVFCAKQVSSSSDLQAESKRLARELYFLIRKSKHEQCVGHSGLQWDWEKEATVVEAERLEWCSIRNIQTVSLTGKISDIFVVMATGSDSLSDLVPGDLIVSVGGHAIEQIDKNQELKQTAGEEGKPFQVAVRRVIKKPNYMTFHFFEQFHEDDSDHTTSVDNTEQNTNDGRITVFVGCSDENKDDKDWAVRLACALSDLGFVQMLVCERLFANFCDRLNVALKSSYYIPIFSPLGFSEAAANCLVNIDQLNTMFDQFMDYDKKVLPIARCGMTWKELTDKLPTFCQRPLEISSDVDVTKSIMDTARKFYDEVPAVNSSLEWEWSSTTKTVVCCLSISLSQIQVVCDGKFSTVLVIGQPSQRFVTSDLHSGDKVVAVNGNEVDGSITQDVLDRSVDSHGETMSITVCPCSRKPQYWDEPLLLSKWSNCLQLNPVYAKASQQKNTTTVSAVDSNNYVSIENGCQQDDVVSVSFHPSQLSNVKAIEHVVDDVKQEVSVQDMQAATHQNSLTFAGNPPDVCHNEELSPQKGELPDIVWSSLQDECEGDQLKVNDINDLWNEVEEIECEKTDVGLGLVFSEILDHEKRPLALFLTDATRCITADGTLSVGDRLLSVGEHDLTHLDCAAAREVFKKLPVGRVMLKIQRACHPSYWSDDSQSLLVQDEDNMKSADFEEVELTSYEEQHIDVAAGDDLSLETKPHEELKLGHQKIVGSELPNSLMTDLMERGAGEASAMSDVSTPYEVQPTVGQLSDHTNALNAVRSNKQPLTAEDLLRPHWVALNARLEVSDIVNHLYERQIISLENMEMIKCGRTRQERAYQLLMMLNTRSWADVVQFGQILSQYSQMRDLGQKILVDAGKIEPDKLLDVRFLVQENIRLQQESIRLQQENYQLQAKLDMLTLQTARDGK